MTLATIKRPAALTMSVPKAAILAWGIINSPPANTWQTAHETTRPNTPPLARMRQRSTVFGEVLVFLEEESPH